MSISIQSGNQWKAHHLLIYIITDCASQGVLHSCYCDELSICFFKPPQLELSTEVANNQTPGAFWTRHKVPVHASMCAACTASSSGLPLLQHLQVHADRFLDGLLGDEVDKVLDVGLPARQQSVDGGLPHHGLGDLSGVVWRRSKRIENQFANIIVRNSIKDALKYNEQH